MLFWYSYRCIKMERSKLDVHFGNVRQSSQDSILERRFGRPVDGLAAPTSLGDSASFTPSHSLFWIRSTSYRRVT